MSAALTLNHVWATSAVRRLHAQSAHADGRHTAGSALVAPGHAFYRRHTERLLRQYMAMSMQVGRCPSLLDNCTLRGRVSSHRVRSFEDAVIFILDMEKCLKRLGEDGQQLVARIALQEYTHSETAEMLGLSVRTVARKYADTLDRLTAILLTAKLLSLPNAGPNAGCCQERGHGETDARR